ncbi:DUF3341 domain-containing protein [Telmatocola sphagniphila]|uniref:DUF3341 domain-containing protein n=1 Tax=Telmatocola sphagniphila TaxID=1123043 RepID=A0A8E6B8U8_9BACT|nr:quinol:electron acceptor oxidoreductase subunit ActD [Telmatocola sphagniphila]QVL33261.1 DUF3341 domain-containing protein [Telmatocola sphagniphila]
MSSTAETAHGSGHSGETLPRIQWVEPIQQDFHKISQTISSITEKAQPDWWWPAFLMSATILLSGVMSAVYLISTGVGVWGSNIPVGWAFDITNFVFWIGIGHAGTLISAILFLFRQKWRTSINRFSEAMTIFAVICAGVYPGIHVGRFWYAWFMFPLPNANWIFQNFRSALLWDLFAVSTYFTISLLFWYTGLVPDLATLRDRATNKYRKTVFGVLSFGWRGSTRHWRHYEIAYLILAGFSTPLVLSVHSVVSFDFATSIIPGWHTTIFPPYFVAGAIFGGFGMVLQCMIPVRAMYPGIRHIVTERHMDVMAKFILATGTLVGYAYAMEFFIAWYGGDVNEIQTFIDRATGNYWWAYWIMVSCNLFIPQLYWMKSWRTTPWKSFIIVTFVNIGMWYERFVIIVQSLHKDLLPGSWGNFYPSYVDWIQMFGDFGLFFTLTLLFIRFLPMIAMSEVKGVLPFSHPHGDHSPQPPATPKVLVPADELVLKAEGGKGVNWGIVAEFNTPAEIRHAAETLRDAGYKSLDAYTPYPVHGMVRAIGMTRSPVPWITICGSITGLSTAIIMQFGLMTWWYPTIVQGKLYRAWEAFIPICFELTVLISGIFTVLGLIGLCGLPRLFHPLDQYRRMSASTDNGFFLTVEAKDPMYNEAKTTAKLQELGGYNIAVVEA